MTPVDWIAIDWGTSHLRIWAMSHAGAILAQRANQNGMATLSADRYESVLLELINDWLAPDRTTPLLVCGMAGSREGWREAPYIEIPAQLPEQLAAVEVPTADPRLRVHILPGLKQIAPADVMRGEETQIAGFVRSSANFDGILVLPGTHTKWVRVRERTIREFTTVMTGELFHLLGTQSILRHSIRAGTWRQEVFDDRFRTALEAPSGFTQRLFSIRAESILHGQDKETAYARLSAELIAMEIAALQTNRLIDQQTPIAVIGTSHLASLYQRALALTGRHANTHSGEDLAVLGLWGYYQTLGDDS